MQSLLPRPLHLSCQIPEPSSHTLPPPGQACLAWGHHQVGLTAAPYSPNPRQVDEGVWPPPNNLLTQSPKKVTAETDFNKSLDFEMPPPSPPLNLHELSGPADGAPPTPKGGNPTKGLDAAGKRSTDKAVSVEVLGLGRGCMSSARTFLSPSQTGKCQHVGTSSWGRRKSERPVDGTMSSVRQKNIL